MNDSKDLALRTLEVEGGNQIIGTVMDNSPFILYTEFHSFYIFFRYVCFHGPTSLCHVEYIRSLSYLDFREGNCLSHQKSGKTLNFMYNTYGELSTTCHHFEYRPLEIARFQRAVTSLFFAWFCSTLTGCSQ